MNKIILFCLLVLPLLYTAALAEDTAAYRSVQIAKSDNYSLARRAAITMKWRALNPKKLKLKSASALVVDSYGNDVYAKDADRVRPIASITKLMTAMVTLDAKLPLEQKITISREDRKSVV